MKSLKKSLVTILMATAMALFVSAQQSRTNSGQQNQSTEGMEGMQGMQKGQTQHGNMNQMMQKCQSTMQPMMQTNNQAKQDIEAAKTSNDPAKMRSALDEAEKAIDGMNTHMTSCMSMMQNMHGMMGSGMMGGESKPQTQNPPKQ
jgi:hypothetical protein